MVIDVLDRDEMPFPHSLPEFQRLFTGEAAGAAYLERTRWRDGFVCPHCAVADEPRYISTRRSVLRCRHCRRDTSLTAGTIMERTHTPLSVWFWAAYLVTSQTPGMSAVQFLRQLGLSRYETAFQILHKLRAGMVRPNQDSIGGKPEIIVEADETWIGGRTRGKGLAYDFFHFLRRPKIVKQDRSKPSNRARFTRIYTAGNKPRNCFRTCPRLRPGRFCTKSITLP